MQKTKLIDFPAIKTACSRCSLQQLCLPQGLNSADMERLDQLVKRPRPLHRGEYLFCQGDRLKSLYAVRSGSFKTYSLGEDGNEKILGFHLPGELLGLAGLGHGEYRAAASALETASVCAVPFDRLQDLADHLPSLNHQLHKIMSQRISRDQEVLLLLGDKSAQERLATFLLNISSRFAERGFSAREFNLSMSRQDIANYLGLTLETISRTFSHLQKDGALEVDRRLIRIVDRECLANIAGACFTDASSATH
ncbi:MAG: fumarate/nitrate reduction transcriptional regulator Fnr [Gammaproteobacteria bacterium]|nr:fumarate/nitrate reduction transcriptional regulator Fnr [Gammaproteobacteria bacterium]